MQNHLYKQCQLKAAEIVASYKGPCEAYNYVATATLMVAAIVATVASAAVSTYAAYAQGQAQQKMADWNAKVARNSAFSARLAGEAEANQIRTRGLKLIGAEQAAAGRSGVTLTGSSQSVMYDSSLQNELDQMTEVYKGSVMSDRDLNQSIGDQYQGQMAEQNAQFGMAGSLLTGAGSVATAGMMYNMQTSTNPAIS